MNLEELYLIYNWEALTLFAVVVFLVRPLGVFLSSVNSGLKLNEKLFISWVGPRGIVAAGIASLFGLKLAKQGVDGAEYITPMVFLIVLGTVLLNATTARAFAKMVGVFLKKSEGILIIGGAEVSRLIAAYLQKNNRNVVLIDSNRNNVKLAESMGLQAIEANIYNDQLEDNIELNDVGFLMALTGNSQINKYAIDKFKGQFGENGSFRLITPQEMSDPENNPEEGLFSHTDDYIQLTEVARKYPSISEIKLKGKKHYDEVIATTVKEEEIIPIFIKEPSGEIQIISSYSNKLENIKEGSKLVYMGKSLEAVEVEA